MQQPPRATPHRAQTTKHNFHLIYTKAFEISIYLSLFKLKMDEQELQLLPASSTLTSYIKYDAWVFVLCDIFHNQNNYFSFFKGTKHRHLTNAAQ